MKTIAMFTYFDKYITQFLDRLNIKSLIRVKGNLYQGQNVLSQHA